MDRAPQKDAEITAAEAAREIERGNEYSQQKAEILAWVARHEPERSAEVRAAFTAIEAVEQLKPTLPPGETATLDRLTKPAVLVIEGIRSKMNPEISEM